MSLPRPLALASLVLPLVASACRGANDSQVVAAGAAAPLAVTGREPVVGLPCEGCEAVFDGLPAALSSSARIAPSDEPGEPLVIEGVVRDERGVAVEGVVVYAYHTDARGIYPPDERASGEEARRHGRLRAWARSDAQGRYRFDTIRPAGYPDSEVEQHVHMHVIEPGRCTYWIDELWLADDPRLTEAMRAREAPGRGGPGLAQPTRGADGVWRVTRDVVLGAAVPGYPPREG